MKTNTLHSLLLALLVAVPGSLSAHDNSFTGLGNVPSGMGLGTTPGGKLDRKQDLSVSHAENKHGKLSKKFHHHRQRKSEGSRFPLFTPEQIFIIRDPEARYRARRHGGDAKSVSASDSSSPNSFEEITSGFAGNHTFEEIRAQFSSRQYREGTQHFISR